MYRETKIQKRKTGKINEAKYRESNMRFVRIIEGENKANRREQIR